MPVLNSRLYQTLSSFHNILNKTNYTQSQNQQKLDFGSVSSEYNSGVYFDSIYIDKSWVHRIAIKPSSKDRTQVKNPIARPLV